ncbi:DinB family protein [Ferruginibacter albus]|uniref:DinB family protein n=1 Tax=Ferruginibacter albus TaxID=2875540 RepID=UPI001CC6849C|nr:DinB family protein [Ferruginibacter albus]UAY53033.1 DinB family protein [Ferruginibacter albus]
MPNEVSRILQLLTDLQHGESWVGTSFKEALQGVNAEAASISDNHNSIWQLVSHLIYWRTRVYNRLNGNNNPPPFMDFRLPEELTEETWKQTIHDFELSYHTLRTAIHNFKEENLSKPSPKEGQTFYQLLHGSLLHDAYHLGQIVLIKKNRLNAAI